MENKKRLIDANAKELIEKIDLNFGAVSRYSVKHILATAPKVDAVEVVHGRWERFEEISGNIGVSCSACGWKDYRHGRFKCNLFHYCPNCGAKMDGGNADVV